MSNTLPANTPNLGVRVLSFDGGGAGALSELLILERLMYQVQASKFEEDLKHIFKEEYMSDSRVDACKTFVCAMNTMNMNAAIAELFRTYDTLEEPANECFVWEAARATSATPGLFKSAEIGSDVTRQRYIDGGFGHNNPTTLVLEEAKQLYPSRPVVLMTSIGSGYADTIQISKSPSQSAILQVAERIARDCERTHDDNARRFSVLPGTYFRFNVQQGLQGLEPHQWEKSAEVLAHTNAYLRSQEVKAKLTEAVKVLLHPVIPLSESAVYVKVCPPPTVWFTGRADLLDEMSQYFKTDLGQRHIFLLHGLGGAGKSQIAFKFIHQSSFSEVYFVDSSSEETIENDPATIALAKKLGKDSKVTLRWLAHQTTEWLILFNNADDISLNLARYFPTGSHGSILITSRNPDLRQNAYKEHKVDRMQLEEAIDLLLSAARHSISAQENRQIGKQLVERLHCLPLAVAQAGAYISSSRALARYLELYETTTKRIQLPNQRPSQ
ncbi:acyl transferase/acyl hydrolase/lysophospholipase [Mycena rosella]|uniref:Acyl transferase/acyl hydrolase/lysophospholipase n=1 Tax=Mycena rosella TaxID=1033263 RepID=A0AAD7CX44_MYCRO|nr:acyl transferase/acyl hydrolase/lysophospholipase [Mycena rosella]